MDSSITNMDSLTVSMDSTNSVKDAVNSLTVQAIDENTIDSLPVSMDSFGEDSTYSTCFTLMHFKYQIIK